jgi:hypothetical protein
MCPITIPDRDAQVRRVIDELIAVYGEGNVTSLDVAEAIRAEDDTRWLAYLRGQLPSHPEQLEPNEEPGAACGATITVAGGRVSECARRKGNHWLDGWSGERVHVSADHVAWSESFSD